ncbi:carbohydrate ABC transporter permease [Clostridium arbusti]|uniref:carbohydrate ABC transporter permease n=1 Tax=Clostridium arbusti TaxID=1137848 RepID=UPI00028A23DA|nr:sugar ABC transporter permease [Clostridium arbusti]
MLYKLSKNTSVLSKDIHRITNKKRMRRKVSKAIESYIYLIPCVILCIIFGYYPFIKNVLYSFSLVDFNGNIVNFVGISNYKDLLTDKNFYISLKNTLYHVAMVLPAGIIISYSLALLANNKRKFSSVYETMFTFPMAISMSAVSLIFKMMLNPRIGIINYIFKLDLKWFDDPKTAMISISIVSVWMGIGFDFLLFLAALRGVPKEMVEASEIDGARFWSKLKNIYIPMTSPTIFFVLCTNAVGAMMMSGPSLVITNGGPQASTKTLIFQLYETGITSTNYAYASTIGVIVFLMTFLLLLFCFRYEKKGVYYQ